MKDFKGFKFIGSKDGRASFKHPKGHYISVATKGLSKEHKQAIEELAKGGKVLRSQNLADGGQTKQPAPKPTPPNPSPPQPPTPPVTAEGIQKGFNDALGFPTGGRVPSSVEEQVDQAETGQPLSVTPSSTTPDPSNVTAQPDSTQDAATEDSTLPVEIPNNTYQGSGGNQEQGYASVAHMLKDEADKTEHDINNQKDIHAESYQDYFNHKDTLGKIGTILGLFVGGAGSGLTGQPNAALQMIDSTIKRDMDYRGQRAKNSLDLTRINQNNPVVATTAAKTGMDTKVLAQQLGFQQQFQMGFDSVARKIASMPSNTPQQAAQKQQAQQVLAALYANGKDKIVNQAAAAQALSGVIQPTQQQGIQPQGKDEALSPILPPGASIQGTQFNPVMEKDRPQVVDQFTKAQQADKALRALPSAYDSMKKNADLIGRASQIAEDLPYGIGHAVKSLAEMDPKTREYNSARTVVEEALVNTGQYTEEQAKHILDSNQHVAGDSDSLSQFKLDNIAGAIKRGARGSMLENYGITKKQR